MKSFQQGNGKIIPDTTQVADIFNIHWVNIVEKSSSTSPNIKANQGNP